MDACLVSLVAWELYHHRAPVAHLGSLRSLLMRIRARNGTPHFKTPVILSFTTKSRPLPVPSMAQLCRSSFR
jgi:hypothetical protein